MNNQDKEKRVTPDAVSVVDKANTNTNDNQDGNAQSDSVQNNTNTIEGVAIVFNKPSKPMDNLTEIIDPHALDGVDLTQVVLLNNHNFSDVLARNGNNLTLSVEEDGLHFTAQLPDTLDAQTVYDKIKLGIINAMSFGFEVADGGDSFVQDADGSVTRTIKQIKSLYEISICTLPAYDGTSVDTRAYEKFLNKNKKEEQRNMTERTILTPEKSNHQEIKSFEAYLRSNGDRRDLQGLTTDNVGKVVVPKEITKPILELTQDKPTLASYITRRAVSSASGTLPVATRNIGTLKTKKELAEVPDIDAQLLQGVDYKLETRIGKIFVSNEEMEDSAIDLTATIKDQLQQLVTNTDNENIVSVLTADGNFQTATASLTANLDDIKKVKNTMLDPQLDAQVVISQTDFNTLDTMKNTQGDYLLQPSVTSPTGKSLLGMDVIEVNDQLMSAGKMFIGSLKESVLEAYKGDISAQWQEFNFYAQGFMAGLRSFYAPISETAGVLVTISGGADNKASK